MIGNILNPLDPRQEYVDTAEAVNLFAEANAHNASIFSKNGYLSFFWHGVIVPRIMGETVCFEEASLRMHVQVAQNIGYSEAMVALRDGDTTIIRHYGLRTNSLPSRMLDNTTAVRDGVIRTALASGVELDLKSGEVYGRHYMLAQAGMQRTIRRYVPAA